MLPEEFTYAGCRMLDFGCGAGRTLRHFVDVADSAELWGVDIDRRSIEWMQANLCPPLNAALCEPEPPLDFEAGYFDFAWAISVFTHLAASSPAWLLELHRVLRPGGLLMASYMGEWNSEAIAGEPWSADRIGFNVLGHDQPWDRGGPMVLMSDWWVREHWGRAFELVAVLPEVHNQTWVLMRRRDVALTPAELMHPADFEREWHAKEHNLVQVEREVVGAHEKLACERELRASIERSLSWRLTSPLRGLKRLCSDALGRRSGG